MRNVGRDTEMWRASSRIEEWITFRQALREGSNSVCTVNREQGANDYTTTNSTQAWVYPSVHFSFVRWGGGLRAWESREMMMRCRLCCTAHWHTLTRADKQQHRWRHCYWEWAAERGGHGLIHSQLLHTQTHTPMHSKQMEKKYIQNNFAVL